jgi:hypothetical protein
MLTHCKHLIFLELDEGHVLLLNLFEICLLPKRAALYSCHAFYIRCKALNPKLEKSSSSSSCQPPYFSAIKMSAMDGLEGYTTCSTVLDYACFCKAFLTLTTTSNLLACWRTKSGVFTRDQATLTPKTPFGKSQTKNIPHSVANRSEKSCLHIHESPNEILMHTCSPQASVQS